MRVAFVAVAALFLLAGCSDGKTGRTAVGGSFDDVDVEATDTTGILLGVVVDEAIRPLPGASVTIAGPNRESLSQVSDDQGRFAFGDLQPGAYLINVELLNYAPAQTTAGVVAGDEEPPIVRVQLTRLFDQDPFAEQIVFDGYLACAYAIGVSSTCVNDYTRIVGERCTTPPAPPACTSQCAGGCFRQYDLARQGGNIREYVSQVGAGWQVIIWEAAWKPTSEFGEQLGFTVSYFSRPNAAHNFGGTGGPSPLRFEEPVGDDNGPCDEANGEPCMIPAEGYDELFTFFSAAGGGVALNQAFRSFETHFYYGLPPDGWSFVNGDPMPF